jgi:non-lysosomal glucosylceramidase
MRKEKHMFSEPHSLSCGRRGVCLALLGLAVAAPVASGAPGDNADGSFAVPTSATTRSLGDIRAQTAVNVPSMLEPSAIFPGTVDRRTASADRGMTLGGVGAGNFEINQAGTFGPWYFGNGTHEWRTMPQAALHVHESLTGAAPVTKTLAVNGTPTNFNDWANDATPNAPAWSPGVMPKWPTLAAGQATYKALYPFGWMNYKNTADGGAFNADISTRFWSPIVAKEDKRTSMPVAYFDARIHNPTDKVDTVSVMFTMPNAGAHVAGTNPPDWLFGGLKNPEVVGTGVSTRTGLTDAYKSDPATGIQGVTMQASDPSNTPDTQDTDWTIAARPSAGQHFSYTTSWNANGSGADVMNAFNDDGTLPDRDLDDTNTASAISVKVTLQPGETTTIPFILAWDFPHDVYTSGTGATATTSVWMRRYTEFFGAKQDAQNNYVPGSYTPHQGWNIADTLLSEHDTNLKAVLNWWQPIVDNANLQPGLKEAALNQLTSLNTAAFWVNGLVSNSVPPTEGSRLGAQVPGTHLFAVVAGGDGADDTSWMSADTTPYAAEAWDTLFPSMEKGYLVPAAEMADRIQGINGMGANMPGSPYVAWTDGASIGGQVAGNISHDSGFVYRAWAYYKATGDTDFLRYAYPKIVKLYDADKTRYGLDTSPLPTGGTNGSTRDLEPVVGTGVVASAHWLLELDALGALTNTASGLGLADASPTLSTELATKLTAGKAALESQLWNSAGNHYNFDTGATTVYDQGVFVDATWDQHLAEQTGLPDIFNEAHVVAHLKTLWTKSIQPFKDDGGRLVGAIDLLSSNYGVFGSAKPDPSNTFSFLQGTMNSREVWAGSQFPLAALMITEGRRTGDQSLIDDGNELTKDVAYQLWDKVSNGYAFQVPDGSAEIFNAPADTDYNTPVAASTTTTDSAAHRNLSFVRSLSVWDDVLASDPSFKAADPIGESADPAPVAVVTPGAPATGAPAPPATKPTKAHAVLMHHGISIKISRKGNHRVTQIRHLKISVAAGSKVTVWCGGPGCGKFKRATVKFSGTTADVATAGSLQSKRLRFGARLHVSVTKPGFLETTLVFAVNSRGKL